MKKILTGFLAAIVLAGLLSTGCALWSGKDDSRPPLSMFTDIPLPPELIIDEKNSQVYEHSIGRVGLMKTSGNLGKEAVLAYFREVMVQNGWTKDSEFDNGEKHMLVFSKSPRSAAITVDEGWISTDVEINVSAKKQ